MRILAAVIALLLVYTTSLCWNPESVASGPTMLSKKLMQSEKLLSKNGIAPAMQPQVIQSEPTRAPAIVGQPIVVDSSAGIESLRTGSEIAVVVRKAKAANTLQFADTHP